MWDASSSSDGLRCNLALTCVEPRGVGDACSAFFPCEDGLACTDCIDIDPEIEGCSGPDVCFPDFFENVFASFPDLGSVPSAAECLSWYSPGRHAQVMQGHSNLFEGAVTYGQGGQLVSVTEESVTVEIGAAYGMDGDYGCYRTECRGFELDVAAELFDCVGNYEDYADVSGNSLALVAELGVSGFNYSKVFVYPPGVPLLREFEVGGAACFSLGPSIWPIPASLGGYDCNTALVTVIGNAPPIARCAEV